MRTLLPRKQHTTALAFDVAGRKLAVGGAAPARHGRNPGCIDVWDLTSNNSVALPTLPGHVLKLAFAPDGLLIAVIQRIRQQGNGVEVANQVILFSGNDYHDSQVAMEWNDDEYRVLTFIPGTTRAVTQSMRRIQL